MSQATEAGVSWPREVMASVVVFLVALPLCLGIAIASGAPPALGLITGIVGGLVVANFAGQPLQVSGPAAGLTVLVWDLIQRYGLGALGVAVLAGGVLQLAAGRLKVGQWFRAVSPAVIKGMLAGIGVLIFASQFHVMVDDEPRGGGLQNLLSIPTAIYKGVLPMEQTTHHLAALLGLITIVTIMLWNRFRPGLLRPVPGPLVGVTLATVLAFWWGFPVQRVDVPSDLASNLNIPAWDTFALLAQPGFFGEVLALAFIASAETLLCATAVDQMHEGARTNYDRELMAQGVGNMICGAVGALPMTGVIVRSSANVNAGAKTRYSAVLHGVWLLAFVVFAPWLLQRIPTASLAAILVYIGYQLANPRQIKELARAGRGELLVFVVTVVTIVAFDLLTGVIAGLVLALGKLLKTFSRLEISKDTKDDGEIHVGLRGAASFVRLPALAHALETIPRNARVHLHVGGLNYIDHACMEMISKWQDNQRSAGGEVLLEWDALRERRHQMRISGYPRAGDPSSVPEGKAHRALSPQPDEQQP